MAVEAISHSITEAQRAAWDELWRKLLLPEYDELEPLLEKPDIQTLLRIKINTE